MLFRKLVLAGAALALTPAPAAAQVPRPDDDPFYAAPPGTAAAQPGDVLASREIDITAAGFPLPFEGHQLLYRTTDTKGAPVAAVATVVLPLGEAPPGGRPLLSYQPAEDSLTRDCASSYEIRQGKNSELLQAMEVVLQADAALVVPDYEGPDSQWVAGGMAAHGVLDAVRATQRFELAGLDGVKTPVGLWGYSGGGHATAWAAELHRSYAPELNIVGAAHGGAPYSLRTTIANMDGSPYAGILLAAVVGISRAYPEMRLDEVLNDAGKEMKASIGDDCIEDFAGAYPGRRIDDFTTVPNAKDLPHIAAVIDDNDLGQRAPKAPLFIYHSATDELNPIDGTDQIVDNYCSRGVTVEYERAAGGEHIEYAVRGGVEAAGYMIDRFAGEPAPNTCPRVSPNPPRICTITIRVKRRDGERIRKVVARGGGRRLAKRRGRNVRRIRVQLAPGRHTIRLKLRTTRGKRTVVVRRNVTC